MPATTPQPPEPPPCIDQPRQGYSPLEDLRAVREAVDIGVAVAGGIHVDVLVTLKQSRSDIVVVGSAITGAADPTAATSRKAK
jgi:3-keto-L-gulonate-6-phosphate decarboxylase